jgi:TolB-like protein/Flp pilus assembly protein TadD
MTVFAELKRRNVFRVGIAYVVGAWVLAQAADLVLDVLGAPDIVLRSLVALLALGLVPTLIFAWAFEITPEGVKRESQIDRSQSVAAHTARKLNLVTIGLVIAAVVLVAVDRVLPTRTPETNTPADVAGTTPSADSSAQGAEPAAEHRSIAVLPFANRSNQADDLFFTDGIHDDLLTQLAKVHDLRVISRTSVMEYRDTTKNLRQIGTELGVATILEGGIQKVGNRVRINAQLIEAATDRHLWAETFDRELTAENIFDLQSEIARKIVSAISIELTPEENQRLAEVPTQNLAAYEAYLRARSVYFTANYSRAHEAEAQPWLEQAIALDPNYVDAYVLLGDIYGQLYWRGLDNSEQGLEKYRALVEKARKLNPDSAAALRAAANYHYRVENDYHASLELLNRARELSPGDVDVLGSLGSTQRRLGRFEESIASYRRALELDPANRFYRAVMLETMGVVADWRGVIDNSVPLEEADPQDLDIQLMRAIAQFNLSGDLAPADRALQKMHLDGTWYYGHLSTRVHWYRRDADSVIATLNNPVWKQYSSQPDGRTFGLYKLANAYRLKGDAKKANEVFEQLVLQKDKLLKSNLQTRVFGGMTIAVALARLGRYDEANALADQLIDEVPLERDAMLPGWMQVQKAMITGLAGDKNTAAEELARAMQIPTSIRLSAWDLRMDPNWDFMRDNPRFEALATPK